MLYMRLIASGFIIKKDTYTSIKYKARTANGLGAFASGFLIKKDTYTSIK